MANAYALVLSGKQGSGKTTTAKALHRLLDDMGFLVADCKFAGPLYEMHDAVLPILKKYGLVPEDTTKVGRILQLLGTEGGRDLFGEDVWVRCALKRFEELKKLAAQTTSDCVLLIDDCRFLNELEAFQGEGLTVRLEAPREQRKSRADAWRDTEDHASETSLDGHLHRFDMVLNTVELGVASVSDAISMEFQERARSGVFTGRVKK